MRGRGVEFGTTTVHHLALFPQGLHCGFIVVVTLGKPQIAPKVNPVLHNRLLTRP